MFPRQLWYEISTAKKRIFLYNATFWLRNRSDQMKTRVSIALVAVAVVAAVGMNYDWDDKPDYIQSAESRVGSYLTSDYGSVACNSTRKSEERWELGCVNKTRGKTFQFAVYPSEKAPYGVSRSFYLEAINDDAKQSADQGLMRYLQINTKSS